MSCHICTRDQSTRLRLFCPTCARNQLYQLRVDHASILLEREHLGQQIETAVRSGSEHKTPSDNPEEHLAVPEYGSTRLWALQRITNEQAQSSARTKALRREIENLRSQIKDKNFAMSQRKLELARRRSDAESAKYQLAEREAATLAGIQNNIKRTSHLWEGLHKKTVEARIFLSREIASLYLLRQKIKRRDGVLKETYMIGGISIIDLRDMNGKSQFTSVSFYTDINTQIGAAPDHISTSLSYIATLLVIVSHYLSLRLPAEIRLPDRNHPTPTIYTPSASYLPREAYSSSPEQSLSSSPKSSRTTNSRAAPPRPRPLTIDKSLPKLAREDPATYALFIEGATLLAWNVSWLCRSQGINVESESWEGVCDIGRNMWQLLVAPPAQSSALVRALSGREMQAKHKAAKDSPRATLQRTISLPGLGHYSHGTAHSFLAASRGTKFMNTWRLPTPTRVADKLKSTLLGEMASAEWELLEEKEWYDATDEPTEPPPNNNKVVSKETELAPDPQRGTNDTESLAPKPDASDAPSTIPTPRPKGTSGWTKLRDR